MRHAHVPGVLHVLLATAPVPTRAHPRDSNRQKSCRLRFACGLASPSGLPTIAPYRNPDFLVGSPVRAGAGSPWLVPTLFFSPPSPRHSQHARRSARWPVPRRSSRYACHTPTTTGPGMCVPRSPGHETSAVAVRTRSEDRWLVWTTRNNPPARVPRYLDFGPAVFDVVLRVNASGMSPWST